METVSQIVTELNPDINNWSENDATKEVSETNWVSWGESSTQDHHDVCCCHWNGLLTSLKMFEPSTDMDKILLGKTKELELREIRVSTLNSFGIDSLDFDFDCTLLKD